MGGNEPRGTGVIYVEKEKDIIYNQKGRFTLIKFKSGNTQNTQSKDHIKTHRERNSGFIATITTIFYNLGRKVNV